MAFLFLSAPNETIETGLWLVNKMFDLLLGEKVKEHLPNPQHTIPRIPRPPRCLSKVMFLILVAVTTVTTVRWKTWRTMRCMGMRAMPLLDILITTT
jgi:hypothetical protein